MATDVVMPQMGESIAEGTIVRWIKKVGDPIDKDEPLFEISTDKVDAEIPSPGAGVVLEITVKEGETVPVNSVVARIGAKGEQPAAGASTAAGAMPAEAPAAAPGTGPDGAGVTAGPTAVKPAPAPRLTWSCTIVTRLPASATTITRGWVTCGRSPAALANTR